MINLKTKTATLLTIGALSVSALAQGFFSPLVPDATGRLAARQLALGMTHFGASNSGNALYYNPALMSAGDAKVRVTGGIILKDVKEERSFPVQDSFDDYLADNTYVYNHLARQYYSGSVIAGLGRATLGLSVSPYQLFEFDYEEEVRGSVYGEYNRDPLVGYHRIQNLGALTGYSAGGNFRLLNFLTTGVSATLVTGREIDHLYEIEVLKSSVNLAGPDTLVESTADIDPVMVFNAGLKVDLGRHLSVAFGFKSAYDLVLNNPALSLNYAGEETYPTLTVDYADTLHKITLGQPAEYTLSLAYSPMNEVPTTIYLDLSYEPWEGISAVYNEGEDMTALGLNGNYDLQNVFRFRLGIEHVLFSGFPVRLGFCHEPSPLGNDLARNWFTLGTAYRFDRLTLDLAGAFCNSEYNYADLFPISGEERLDWDTVDNRYFTGKISLSYEF